VNRHLSRCLALEALYAAEQGTTGDIDCRVLRERADERGAAEPRSVAERACGLAEAVWQRRAALDTVLEKASERWRVGRMPVIDRNVLRIGVLELLDGSEPPAVVIDEAVRLAKEYSTARSGAFVNGILGRVLRDVAPAENSGPR
jgi:N utilization substance protein B